MKIELKGADMALIEKNRKAIESDPVLSAKVRELWARNADAGEFYEVLKEAGLDVDRANVEDTVAQLARLRGEIIADERVDAKLLAWVAGGGTGNSCSKADDCDDHFQDENYWPIWERCNVMQYCDQVLSSICSSYNS